MNALLLLLLAGAPSAPTSDLKPVAWSEDGQWLVYTGASPSPDDAGATVAGAAAVNVSTSQRVAFSVDGCEEPITSLQKCSPSYAAWAKVHKPKPVAQSRVSPDGKSTADVRLPKASGEGTWVNGKWKAGSAQGWELIVATGSATKRAAATGGGDSVHVSWSPDGLHTAWVIVHGGRSMRDTGYDELIIGTDGAPSLGLSLSKDALTRAEALAAAVSSPSGRVVGAFVAKKPRDASVVYFAKGLDAEAKAVAEKVPGGALTAPMDWAAPYDLVLAAGPAATPASAAPKK